MTIDEAIKDLEYGTEQLEMEIKSGLWIKGSESELSCKESIALNKQYIEWLTELKEAKRLLKAAIEDLSNTAAEAYNGRVICKCCKWLAETVYCKCPNDGGCDITYQWRYADEALKLIGDSDNDKP